MHRFGKVAIAAALPLAVGAKALTAQVAGIPVYYNPRGGMGVSAAANVGWQTAGTGGLEGKAYALTGGLGAGPAYVTVSVGRFNPDPAGLDNEMTYGGTVSFKVFGGGVLPVSISAQAGVGYMKSGTDSYTSVPLGVGVGLNVPLFPIKPWVAPRVRLARTSGGGQSDSETFFGVSAGADFNLLLGLGFHAAVDYEPKKTVSGGEIPSTTVVGVGAHFNFRVPMM
jgi:hypothetical protein